MLAAGNDGPDPGTVGSPGDVDAALTVGAVDRDEQIARFTSRGPRIGDNGIKPDITAPGVDIVAARAKGALPDFPEVGPGGRYTSLDGTSMATPHVAAAAAILVQEHPDWTHAQIKAGLMASARPNTALGVFDQGAGRIDLAGATTATVTANPASVSFGNQSWPHSDDTPVVRTVTYHNAGKTPVTLTLALPAKGADGKPLPARLFRLSAPTLTVPAGGDAAATVTADTKGTTRTGLFSGELLATGGGRTVPTPIAVYAEPETYPLAVTVKGPDGKAAPSADVVVIGADTSVFIDATPESTGTATVQVPKGRYAVAGFVWGGDEKTPTVVLVDPQVTVDRAQAVAMDARTGRPLQVSVPRTDAAVSSADVGFDMSTPAGTVPAGVRGSTPFATARVGTGQAVPGFTARAAIQLARPGSNGQFTDSPYVYNLAWFGKGGYPAAVPASVTDAQLAHVQADLGAQGGQTSLAEGVLLPGGTASAGFVSLLDQQVPKVVDEYFTTGSGQQWENVVGSSSGTATAYRAGHSYREIWNRGVFGPGLTPDGVSFSRTGEKLIFAPSLYTDGAGRSGSSGDAHGTLYQGGAKVAEFQAGQPPQLTFLNAGAAQYTATVEADRGAPFDLSTRVEASWTFRSAHVPGATSKPIPALAVRFTPALDANSGAPAGADVAVPVVVDRQGGAGAPRTLTVQVSFDDGKTWRDSPVKDGKLTVHDPAGHGFVSFKAAAADGAGNAMTETIIHAYRY